MVKAGPRWGTLSWERGQESHEGRMNDRPLFELVCGAGGSGQFAGTLSGGQPLRGRQDSLGCCTGGRNCERGRAVRGAAAHPPPIHPQRPFAASQPHPSRLSPPSHYLFPRPSPPRCRSGVTCPASGCSPNYLAGPFPP
ncbi:hypothetical protein lerEdw1_004061 [Lerista edwardsae]|nr:hypothetical protein lerEdw1_004061 [Lerista edwardsae]